MRKWDDKLCHKKYYKIIYIKKKTLRNARYYQGLKTAAL